MTIVGKKGPGNYMVFSQNKQEKDYYSVGSDGMVSATLPSSHISLDPAK